jgi:hypothetical protein
MGYVGGTAFLQLLFPWMERLGRKGAARRVLVFAALGLAAGAFAAESTLLELLGAATAAGLAFFAVSELVARTSVALLIPLAATPAILAGLRVAVLGAYPGATTYGLLLAVGVAAVSWVWFGRLVGGRDIR